MISRLIPVLIYLSNGNCWTKLNQAFVDPRPSNLRYYLSQIGNFSAVCTGKQCSHQETPCSQGRINQLGEFEGALMVPYSARPSSLIHLRKTYTGGFTYPLTLGKCTDRIEPDLSVLKGPESSSCKATFWPSWWCELRSCSICQGWALQSN